MTKYTLTIAYQRESTTLSDLDGDATTVGDIKAQLAQIYQVPEPAQSLLYRGKKLQDNTALLDSLGFPMTGQIKLMLLGTRADDAAKVVAALAAATAPPPARGPGYKPVPLYNRVSSKSSPHTLSSLATEHTNHTFLEIQTLPQFSNQAGARAILERLRDDPGIARVMQTRRWTVGQLIELSPAEATILGYNRNRGQVIALRLRTNDLSGFRAYRNIRMVLIHELAHMVFDEHANDFKALNSELTKDVGMYVCFLGMNLSSFCRF
ncbi:WLM domain-containing protein [Blastocladiella britannica]|nr:WLM domain-containing protein [Blastocladiella britannica]